MTSGLNLKVEKNRAIGRAILLERVIGLPRQYQGSQP